MRLVQDVVTKELKVIADDRGWLMEMLRRDDPFFRQFGQVYVTACYPGVVKGWHFHKKQWDHFVVVAGNAKVVLHDTRDGSSTKGETNVFFLGDRHPMLLSIPPFVLHGFTAIGGATALLVNCPTEPYDAAAPDEYRVAPHGVVPYDWAVQDG